MPELILSQKWSTDGEYDLEQRICWLYGGGLIPYRQAWEWQQRLVQSRVALLRDGSENSDLPDALLLLEHPPVYTLGQGSSLKFLKFDPTTTDWELYRTERGGEVTYHCPGQLVAYPIFNLRHYRQDLHWYLRQLEAVVIRTLAVYGVWGERIPGLTGVWVEGRKIAAIGIKASRWITMHGLALNVCPDLAGFAQIVPCGIADRPVGSLAEFVPEVDLVAVRRQLAIAFAEVFHLQLVVQSLANLDSEFTD